MKIFLVRHGYSIANSKKLVTGDKEDELFPGQVDKVRELSLWLQEKLNVSIDEYYVSDWCRAQQTANIIYPDVEWQVDSRIGETDAGSVKNLTLDEFLELKPEFYAENSNRYPDGESHLELNYRVLAWLNELLAKKDNNRDVMVVSHSGPISCILQHVCGVSMDKFPAFLPDNASISCIDVTYSGNGQLSLRLKFFSAGPGVLFG